MINPYNQKIKSVNIIRTFSFLFSFFPYTCSKIVISCVSLSDKDLYSESGNDTFIIHVYNRERERERENSSLKQQHAAGQKTQPLVNRHAPCKISYCTLKRQRKRNKNTSCTNKRHIFINRNLGEKKSHILTCVPAICLLSGRLNTFFGNKICTAKNVSRAFGLLPRC